MNEGIELNLAYIVLYSKFMKWLEPYSEGQHDEDALTVYSVFAGTPNGSGLFEAYAAGMKQGLQEGKQDTIPEEETAAPKPEPLPEKKKTADTIRPADELGALFQTLKEANGITA